MDSQTDVRTDGQTDRRMDGQTNGWTDGWTDKWTDGWTDGQTNRWIDGLEDGWMDGQKLRQTEGRWTDILTYRQSKPLPLSPKRGKKSLKYISISFHMDGRIDGGTGVQMDR